MHGKTSGVVAGGDCDRRGTRRERVHVGGRCAELGLEHSHVAERGAGVLFCVNPGSFFRIASPLAQVLSLLALILSWNVPGAPLFAGIAVAANVTGDLMTFAYFYPRNDIMFVNPMNAEVAAQAWREWATMNHVRSALVLTALLSELATLTRVAQMTPR
jgi:hypothetical protein